MQRRRAFLKTASIVALPALAGCSDQSGGDADSDGDGTSGGDGNAGDGPSDSGETTADEETTEAGTDTGTPDRDGATTTPTATETLAPTGTASAEPTTLVLNNVGAQAWEVTEDESGSVASLSEENPTLTFEVGRRYAVRNDGWSAHPFALRADDDTPLLSQSADGEYEDDDAVDWTDDGETLAFTVTDDLAADVDYYICTVHPGMRGGVETA